MYKSYVILILIALSGVLAVAVKPLHALSITVTWDYTDSGQTGFELLRCSTGGADCNPTTVLGSTIGPTLRQVTDSTILDQTHYCFTIRAVKTGNPSSALSSPFCLTIDATLTFSIQWDYTDSTQTGFEVLRCTGTACTPSTVLPITLGPSARGANDPTALAGTTYCYAARAIQSGQPSSALSPTSCATPTMPQVPAQLAYSPAPGASTTNVPMTPFTVRVLDAYGTLIGSSTATITVSLQSSTQTAIPQNLLTLVSVDSEEFIDTPGAGVHAIDGDPTTFWHSSYSPTVPLPHTIIVDLGQQYSVSGFKELPRQDSLPNANYGTVGQYEFSLSTDGGTWGSPVAQGTFPTSPLENTVTFAARTARYTKFVALSSLVLPGGPYTAIAELTFLQTPLGGGGLTGVTVLNAVGGQATFTPAVTQAGSYVMQATAAGLTGTAAPFVVTDGIISNTSNIVRRMGH